MRWSGMSGDFRRAEPADLEKPQSSGREQGATPLAVAVDGESSA